MNLPLLEKMLKDFLELPKILTFSKTREQNLWKDAEFSTRANESQADQRHDLASLERHSVPSKQHALWQNDIYFRML
jgi:hypothetical protein